MAEYIEKEDIKKNCSCTYNGDCWGNCSTCSDKALFIADVDDLPTSDVVERSEYNKMVQAFKARVENQKDNLIATRNAYYEVEKENAELRSKIDDAIKEMERYSTAFEYADRHDLASAVDYCIGVIQESIGEK